MEVGRVEVAVWRRSEVLMQVGFGPPLEGVAFATASLGIRRVLWGVRFQKEVLFLFYYPGAFRIVVQEETGVEAGEPKR